MRSTLNPRQADNNRLRGGIAMTITVGGSLPPGTVDEEYYAELTATGGTPPYTWISDTPLPDGLELAPLPDSQQAAIRGVPTESGSTQCTIRVTDSAGGTAPYPVSLDFSARLTIATEDLPPGVEGKPYTATLNAAGGSGPYTWTASGAPGGLSVNAHTGAISWTPATAGTRFTIQAADSAGRTAEGSVAITVRPARWWNRLSHIGNWLALLALGVPAFGSLWIAIYSFATPGAHWSYLGTGMLTAIAAFLSGCFIGFLFGIPKVISSGQLRHNKPSQTYVPSTNLAEVSDWLTKLLLGAGLVQLTRLGTPIGHLINTVAAGLTPATATVPSSAATVMAGAILFGYAVIGLLDAYVVTTMWYQQRLEKLMST
jgi:hypothetical protein